MEAVWIDIAVSFVHRSVLNVKWWQLLIVRRRLTRPILEVH